MIRDYLSGKITAVGEGGEPSSIQYGTHLDILKFINEKEYQMGSGTFSKDFAMDMLVSNGCWLVIKRPQTFSVSLAKALCLSEEKFLQDFNSEVLIQRRRAITDKKY